MAYLLFLVLVLPLIGAGGVLMITSLHSRILAFLGDEDPPFLTGYFALGIMVLALGLTLALYWMEPVTFVPSLRQSSQIFGSGLRFRSTAALRPLALALALAANGALLLSLGRPDDSSPALLSVTLALFTVGLASLWAANVLTMIVCWAIFDLLRTVGHLAAGGSRRGAIRGLAFGGIATLLLWIGTLLADVPDTSGLWAVMTIGEEQLFPWAAAGLIRLWIYPLHIVAPDDLDVTVPLVLLPLVMSPIVGWGLWLRLAAVGGETFTVNAWWLTPAALAVAIGGFSSWAGPSLRRSLAWMAITVNGTVVLAAGLLEGDRVVALMSAGGATSVLGVGLLLLSAGLSTERYIGERAYWWLYCPALMGALALVGLPLTSGFVTDAALLEAFFDGERLRWASAYLIGRIFLIAALARWLVAVWPWSSTPVELLRDKMDASVGEAERDSLDSLWGYLRPSIAPSLGLGAQALLLLAAGLYPSLFSADATSLSLGGLLSGPGWAGWLLWSGVFLGGAALTWQSDSLRSRIDLGLSAVVDFLRLEWLYEALIGALERALTGLRILDEIVGGAGTLLWSWIVFLMLLLLLLER